VVVFDEDPNWVKLLIVEPRTIVIKGSAYFQHQSVSEESKDNLLFDSVGLLTEPLPTAVTIPMTRRRTSIVEPYLKILCHIW